MSDCIFCKIINGEISAEIVYDSSSVLGFRDLNPTASTHILFVPKKHYSTLNDIPENELGIMAEMIKGVQKLAKKEGVDREGYRTLINTNKDSGQVIFHLHMHLIGGRKLGKMA